MAEIISHGSLSTLKPEISYSEDGKLQPMGSCWVKGDELGCYDWEDEEMLLILDKKPASDDYVPEDMYYCFNVYRNDSGWVMAHQITFELDSLIDDFKYKLRKV